VGSSPDRNRSPCIFQAAGQASRHGKSDTAVCRPLVPAADPAICVFLVMLVGKLRRGRFLIFRYNHGDTIPIVVPNVIQAIVVMRCVHAITESPCSTCEIWNLRSVSQKLYKGQVFSFGSPATAGAFPVFTHTVISQALAMFTVVGFGLNLRRKVRCVDHTSQNTPTS